MRKSSVRKRKADRRDVTRREAKINSIGILGVGLIGGSIAERLKSRRNPPLIYGYDRPGVLSAAKLQKVIDRKLSNPAHALESCDLIVLSANPETNQKFLKRLAASRTQSQSLIIDTGSTQLSISRLGGSIDWKNSAHFVAGHPMAGREREGLENRLRDLFVGHPFFFDDGSKLSKLNRARLNWFTGALGSYPLFVNPEKHDAIMTDISHLPQLVSTSLASFVAHHPSKYLAIAGTGLQSMIRLGGSPYTNWDDVFKENQDKITLRLTELIANLIEMRDSISQGGSVSAQFKQARRSYKCLW